MICSSYPVAYQQAQSLARHYATPVWVSLLRDNRYLVTLNPSALAGTNILRTVLPPG